MHMKLVRVLAVGSTIALATACATTETSNGSNSSFSEEAANLPKCEYGKDLEVLEAIKDEAAQAEDSNAVVHSRLDQINSIISKTENMSASVRPEDALGCRFLEMEARVLLIELPNMDGQADLYTAAKESVEDVKSSCATTSDPRMCSAARIHDATIFSRRSSSELMRIADRKSDVPINWEAARSLTQAYTEHVKNSWAEHLQIDEAENTATEETIERSLFASVCTADKAMTKINRRVGLSINQDAYGNLVPYGKDSGELLAHAAVALNLSPDDSCNASPTERNCRGTLASKVHLACLRASSVVSN